MAGKALCRTAQDGSHISERKRRRGGNACATCEAWLLPGGEGAEDGEGVEAEADHLGEEAADVSGVVGAVGVEADASAGVFGGPVLVDNPFEGAGVAEAVVEGVGGMPGKMREGLTVNAVGPRMSGLNARGACR